jgi:hypothetical protein
MRLNAGTHGRDHLELAPADCSRFAQDSGERLSVRFIEFPRLCLSGAVWLSL